MGKKSLQNLISEDAFWAFTKAYFKGRIQLETVPMETQAGVLYHGYELYRKAYTSKLWAAAWIVRGGSGNDSFHYFRAWLVNLGNKELYYNALEDPDSLLEEFGKYSCRNEIQDDPIGLYLCEENPALDEFIEENYEMEYIHPSEMEAQIKFEWDENIPCSLRAICPVLYEKYWNAPLS